MTGGHGSRKGHGEPAYEVASSNFEPSSFQTLASHPGMNPDMSLGVLKICPRLGTTCRNPNLVQHGICL